MAKRGDWKGWAREHNISNEEWEREVAKQKAFQKKIGDVSGKTFNPYREAAYNLVYYPERFGQGKESINQRIERRREGQENFDYSNDYTFWKTAAFSRKYGDVELSNGLTFRQVREGYRSGKLSEKDYIDYISEVKQSRAYAEGSVGTNGKRKKNRK